MLIIIIYLTGLLKELNEIMNEKYFIESCVLVIYAPWYSHRISVGGSRKQISFTEDLITMIY